MVFTFAKENIFVRFPASRLQQYAEMLEGSESPGMSLPCCGGTMYSVITYFEQKWQYAMLVYTGRAMILVVIKMLAEHIVTHCAHWC